jgi:hypothetical protein
MAALAANMNLPPRHVPNTPTLQGIFPANAADEYYIGAIVCSSAAATTGRVVVSNADADTTLGLCLERQTVAAAGELITVHLKGVWWIACAQFATGDLWVLHAPTAASDNPADLVTLGIGTPSALGTLIHVDATGVSGYLDFDHRVVPANA